MFAKKKIIIGLLLANAYVHSMHSQQNGNHGSLLSLVKDGTIAVVGVGTIIYGAWNGVVYGIQQALPSREESSKPTMDAILKDVILPIGTGAMILLARSRSLHKNI